jgi:hypothetical protein
MKFRWLLLLGLLACGDEAAPFQMSVEVAPSGPDSEPFSGRIAVGWVQGDQLVIDAAAARPFQTGSLTLALAGEPSVLGGFYPEWSDEHERHVRIGVIAAIDTAAIDTAAIDADSGDVVRLSPASPTVSTFRFAGQPDRRVETWCDVEASSCTHAGCGDISDRCYQEIYECDRADASACELVSSHGDAVRGNRWGHLSGLAEDYLVIHADEEVSEYELMRQGLYVGPLGPGYHLVHGRALEGQELEASRACWKQAEAYADAYRARGPTDALDVDALLANELAHDDLYDGSWAGLRVLIGTVGLACPYQHVRYEVVEPEQVRIDLAMSHLARPLFRFVHPANDL